VVSFNSGGDKAKFALSLDQALWLYQVVQREALAAFEAGGFAHASDEQVTAELLAFPSERVRRA
jgi:hypothetical protein